MNEFLQQLINGLAVGGIYALVALGYTMVYGVLKLINFAHGEVVMIGAMVALTVIKLLAPIGLPLFIVVLIALAAAAFALSGAAGEAARACTNVLVTKGASADGSTMITYACDGRFHARLRRSAAKV